MKGWLRLWARVGTALALSALSPGCSDHQTPAVGGAGSPAAGSSGASSGAASVTAGTGGVGTSSGGSGTSSGGVAGASSSGAAGDAAGSAGSATSGNAGQSAEGEGGQAGSAMGGGGSTNGQAGSGGTSAARGTVTLVIRGSGTPTAGDKVMIGRLEAFGFRDVVIAKDAEADADSVKGSELVVISSSAESGPLRDRLKNIAIPVLCIEDAEFKLMGMASEGDHDAGISRVVIQGAGNPLVGSLTGTVAISSVDGELGWGTPAPAALVAATMPNDPKRAVVFGYPAGAQMVTMAAPARRAGFAIREQLAANLNADGIALFDSILAWVVQN